MENNREKNCCNKKFLCGLCLSACLFVFLGFLLLNYFGVTVYYDIRESYYCTNIECAKSEVEINNFIDPSVDPCEDFAAFACGTYKKNAYKNNIPSPYISEHNRVQNELRSFILEDISDDDAQAVKLQKQFFQACMAQDKTDEGDNQRFVNLIEELGGWPVIKGQSWQESNFTWIGAMIKAKEIGLPFQWFLTWGLHYGDNSTNYLKISFNKHCVSSNSSNFSSFFVFDVAHYLMMSASKVTSATEVHHIMTFKDELWKICENHKVEDISVVTIADLQQSNPKFNWLNLISNLTRIQNLTEDTTIATDVQEYISSLDNLLVRTSKRVQANFIVWNIIEEFLMFLSNPIGTDYTKLLGLLGDLNYPRIQICLQETTKRFLLVSETEFIRRHVTQESIDDITQIYNLVADRLKENIKSNHGLSSSMKNNLFARLNLMEINIAGPFDIFDEEYFNRHYLHMELLNFTSTNIIYMVAERSKTYFESIFNSVGEEGLNPNVLKVFSKNLILHPHIEEELNLLVIPAAMLSDLFYASNRPKYLNFGSFATILAHSLVKYLRDSRIYDKSVLDFDFPLDCLINDSNSTLLQAEEVDVNLIARQVAYEAYQKFLTESEDSLELAALSYSQNQLFWIRSSLPYCHATIIDAYFNPDIMGLQTISEYSNQGPIKHSRYFANDFYCAVGSAMNPKTKCEYSL